LSTAAADATGLEAAAGEEQAAAPVRPRAIANQLNKRLIITAADGTTLALAPLERRELTPELFQRFQREFDALTNINYVALEFPPAETREEWLPTTLGAGIWVVLGVVLLGIWLDLGRWYWIGAAVLLLVTAFAAWRAAESGAVGRWLSLTAALVAVLAAGIGLPATVIWFGANIPDALDIAVNGSGNEQERAILTVLGRGLQLLFIAVVALLPGLLYFLFDRARLATLRERFTRQVFRLDRTLQTQADVMAKYGTIVEETYGPPASAKTRLQPGTQWPILLATIVLAFGWVLVLLNPSVEVVESLDLRALFRPAQTAPAYAFLGAYVFSLTAVVRGFVRGDLRPKTYGYIAVRFIVVIILAWVLEVVIDAGDELLVTAFLAGFFPDTVIYRLREASRWLGGKLSDPDRLPLGELDGVDVYERARLESEGITNIQALAKHDLVDLVLQTRIPVARLVDWTDQAILHLHAGSDNALEILRRNGIRSASDLEYDYEAATERGDGELFRALLGHERSGLPRLSGVVDAIRDEEWMDAIRYWHDPIHAREQSLRFPEPV
jgi:hypothetical protein